MLEMANVAENRLTIRNINEDRVLAAVTRYMRSDLPGCRCHECSIDLLALTLNKTPARYVANELLMAIHDEQEGELTDAELDKSVLNSAIRIFSNPRCGDRLMSAVA